MIKRKNLTKAEIVAHSEHAGSGKELVTLVLTLPRIVLAELNTHRAFSRNSGSSRAIPFKRMRQSVRKNLFIPLAFQKSHKGMQGTEYYETGSFMDRLLVFLWWFASKLAIFSSSLLNLFGATKQLANRILEPFMWHTVIITATEWAGFFRQRCPQYVTMSATSKTWEQYLYGDNHTPEERNNMRDYKMSEKLYLNKGAAEIHISLAAEAIYDAIRKSSPKVLNIGEWHIPFESYIDEKLSISESSRIQCSVNGKDQISSKICVSTALCAMVSFTEVGGKTLFDKIDIHKNIKLHDRLIEDEHMSPTEHCAQVKVKLGPGEHSNFKGNWFQYRKKIEKELQRY